MRPRGRALGQVDILVNNAGGGVIRPTLEHTEETLQATVDNNLWTTIRCTLAVLPHMVERGYGRIINIGAESVRNGLVDHAIYNAAKGGVHGLTTGLAREFAAAGITVNTVAPSYVETPELGRALSAGALPAGLRHVTERATGLIPVGRPGRSTRSRPRWPSWPATTPGSSPARCQRQRRQQHGLTAATTGREDF